MSSELPFDIPNWVTMAIELGIGIPIAIVLFYLQVKTSKKVEKMTEKKKNLNVGELLTNCKIFRMWR
ncbi:MAG TPA: hypothetical protein VIP29_02375 [Nitrososphaeraceae archaeon]